MTTLSVLFVCLGNICRSPMAEALFRQQVKEAGLDRSISVDSAGTGNWHVGDPPHSDTLAVLRKHGIAADGMRARQLKPADLGEFDYLIVMDGSNLRDVEALARRNGGSGNTRIVRLLDYADPAVALGEEDVPDPYYGGGFDHVYRLVESGCAGLLGEIVEQQRLT